MKEVFETPGRVALDLRLPEGDLDVVAEARQDTVVELTGLPDDELLEVARIEMHERGGVFEVRVEIHDQRGFGRFWKSRALRLAVQAPEGADVRARAGSADVRCRGDVGALRVETGSGDLSFDGVAREADVKSGSGDVRLREIDGDAAVSSASGDVNVERIGGTALVRSASGDVHIGEAGADVTVQTASGDQLIGAVVRGQISLQSASGDMRVGIRRGSRLAVDARSLSGDTSSEIDLDDFGGDEGGDDSPLVELRATAMSGDIHVARA
jgi:hypothetical protein